MAEKVISLVLATYNMEQYLSRCLDSIIHSTVLDKVEIIIANDGSKDNTLQIANEYHHKFPESIVIIDKPNGHYGSCINAGLKIAKGKYFRPLDPDDWVDPVQFSSFVNYLENNSIDVVFTNYSHEYNDGKSILKIKHSNQIEFQKIYNLNDIAIFPEAYNALHAITYRTQLLNDINFYQTEGIAYTDVEYCFYPFEAAKSFTFLDLTVYKYYIGRPGQTVSVESMAKGKNNCYKTIERMVQYCDSHNAPLNTLQIYTLKKTLIYYYLIVLVLSPKNKNDDEVIKKLDNWIKDFSEFIYSEMNKYSIFKSIYFIKIWRKNGLYLSKLNGKNWYKLQKYFDRFLQK